MGHRSVCCSLSTGAATLVLCYLSWGDVNASLSDFVQVEGCVLSKFRNAGQTCVCANRVYVHEAVYDQFKEKLVKKVRSREAVYAQFKAG